METAEPFRNFLPKEFFKKRFSPLVATFVDPEADSIVKQCGFSFVDICAATAANLPNPIRIVPAEKIIPGKQDDFLQKVMVDTNSFGQSFIYPEYEQKDEVKPELSPVYGAFKDHFHYPSMESSFPPWYRHMVALLCKSLRYSEFDFFDLPQCILYAIAPGSQTMTADELRKLLSFPEWMKDFLTSVPIVKVVVYDTLLSSDIPKEATQGRGSFESVIPFPFRTRNLKNTTGPDMINVRNLFRYDGNILNNKNLCNYLTDADFQNAKNAIVELSKVVQQYINRTISASVFEIEEQKKFSNSVKNFFSRNSAPERKTSVYGIPWKKIIYSRLAALYLITGKYQESQKNYKLFISQIEQLNLPFIKYSAMFIMGLLCTMIPNQLKEMPEIITNIVTNVHTTNNLRFVLYVPILSYEIHAALGDDINARQLCKKTLDKIRQVWLGTTKSKILITALINERLAGFTREDRKSWQITSKALLLYKQCDQLAHSLRCAIWLLKVLPKQWPLLYQNVWLDKATVLCLLTQGSRSLNECKELLALPNLSPVLHEKAISQFFAPYNDPSMNKSLLNIKINSLLEVKQLRMIDPSVPDYYGFNPAEFKDLVTKIDEWHAVRMDRSYTKSFQSWTDDLNVVGTNTYVSTEQPIYFVVSLYNRYKFTVHLDTSMLLADYKGESSNLPMNEIIYMEDIKDKDIKGYTKELSEIKYKCIPHVPGHFTVHKFKKNYWGYVDTEVECEPILFNCVANYPKVNLSIEDLPEEVLAWQCIPFNVVVENKGESSITEFHIAFDHPRSIVAEVGTENIGEISIIHINGELPPGGQKKVPLIFRAAKLNNNTFHFVISINNNKCGYARACVNVVQAAKISTQIFPRPSDSAGKALAFTITPLLEGLKLFGFMNKNGHLVRTLKFNKEKLPANRPQTFVVFPSDETPETVEPWRAEIMGQAPLAVLFLIGENDNLYAQKNIAYDTQDLPIRLRIDSQSHFTIPKTGGKFNISISCDPLNEPIVIEPAPIQFVARQHQIGPTPCRWIGKTSETLCKENNFTANFTAIALGVGVYLIPNVFVRKPNGSKDTINVSQMLSISIEDSN